MISFIKKGAIGILAFLAFSQVKAQSTLIVYIDSIYQLEPIIMNDSTDFFVNVVVDDTSFVGADSIYGNLVYYYWTDSMINAATPPRVIDNDTSSYWLVGSFGDIVSVDIRPDEIRTEPVNLIILWPAIFESWPIPITSDSIEIMVGFDGYLQLPDIPGAKKNNLLFPVPAMQYIYIRPEEVDQIRQINILTLEGKQVSTFEYLEFKSGFINVDSLSNGNYLVELNYKDGRTTRTRIIKN